MAERQLIDRKEDFGLSENWMLWKPSAHYAGASPLAADFLSRTSSEPEFLFLEGHSRERDKGEKGYRWEHIESLCRLLSPMSDLWIITMGKFRQGNEKTGVLTPFPAPSVKKSSHTKHLTSSIGVNMEEKKDPLRHLEETWKTEHPKLVSRARRGGRTLEEAQDLVGDVFAETLSRLGTLGTIINPAAWINTLLGRRLIDAWRRNKTGEEKGLQTMESSLLAEVAPSLGLDPLDDFVAASLSDALRDAVEALPQDQRQIILWQVYQGESFRSLEKRTGIPAETLASRKRKALESLKKVLRAWIED